MIITQPSHQFIFKLAFKMACTSVCGNFGDTFFTNFSMSHVQNAMHTKYSDTPLIFLAAFLQVFIGIKQL